MDLNDIVQLKFPRECSLGLIQTEENKDGELFIVKFEVSNHTFPTQEEIQAWESEYEDLLRAKSLADEFLRVNKITLDQLQEIDLKSIRALRANDTERLQELEAEAVVLRAQLQVIE
jgi:hypothetical protein